MTFEDLERALLDNLRSFWRIKFALAAARGHALRSSKPVSYQGMPKHTPPDLFSRSETVAQAEEALLKLSGAPLATTFLLASMAQYEAFLKQNIIITRGGPPGLGVLQKAAESNPERPISGDTIARLDEIRERRNIVVHRAGVADERYTCSAAAAQPLSNGAVPLSAAGSLIEVTPAYFTYATPVLIDYCRQVAGLNA